MTRRHKSLRFEPLEDRRLLAITVNTLVDEADGSITDGDISLRDAIALAPAGETIAFSPALTAAGPATIRLTLGQLLVNKDLTIAGPTNNLLTIDAAGSDPTPNSGDGSRVFTIDDGNSGSQRTVVISHLTLTGGDVAGNGGAILNRENLTANNLAITNNAATLRGGGIFSEHASASLIGCTISGNAAQLGGGVYGTGTIAQSTISGNTAQHNGGGLFFNGTVSDSAIENNRAEFNGGGLAGGGTIVDSIVRYNAAGYDGGGVWHNLPTTIVGSTIHANVATNGGGVFGAYGGNTLERCTISANTAHHGGGLFAAGAVTMTNSTISGNLAAVGGALYSFAYTPVDIAVNHSTIAANSATLFGGGVFFVRGALHLNHSIVATNTTWAAAPSDINTLVGNAVTARYSLIGSNAGSPLVEAPIGSPDAQGNLIGGSIHGPIDPMLSILADDGGWGLVHSPLPGSPALNAGDPTAASSPSTPVADGRGAPFLRVAGGRIDIGAVERQSLAPGTLIVDTLVDEDDGNRAPGDLSLREAIRLALGSVGPDAIAFAPALTAAGPARIDLTEGFLLIQSSLSITGPGADLLTIDASAGDPTPDANNNDGTAVFIMGGGGEGLFSVVLEGLTLTGADGSGAIDARCDLTIRRSRITGNSSSRSSYGGGVSINYGTLNVEDSTIDHNSTSHYGGAIRAGNSSALHIVNSSLTDNYAHFSGGAVWVFNATSPWTITGSTISNNRVYEGDGGAIATHNSVTVTRSTISDNSIDNTSSRGAGIAASASAVVAILDSTMSGNVAGATGGAVWGNVVNVTRSTIVNNLAKIVGSFGGGLSANQITLNHSIVAGNRVVQQPATPDDVLNGNTPDDIHGNVTASFSLMGVSDGATITDNGGNLIGTASAPINPLLGPLADNGGPTKTHALLPGSPAINAGNPSVIAGAGGVPLFDQRGMPFGRVVGGRIDIGAVESQPIAPSADFNADLAVDGFDFLAWQRGFGLPAPNGTHDTGDADYDHDVDATDLAAWTAAFGSSIVATADNSFLRLPPLDGEGSDEHGRPEAARAQSLQSAQRGGGVIKPYAVRSSPALIDAAFAMDRLLAEAPSRRPYRPRVRLAH